MTCDLFGDFPHRGKFSRLARLHETAWRQPRVGTGWSDRQDAVGLDQHPDVYHDTTADGHASSRTERHSTAMLTKTVAASVPSHDARLVGC
jgi:hypothetical protein